MMWTPGAVLAVYLAVLVALALWSRRETKSLSGFFLAGKRDAPIQPLESERVDIDTMIRGFTIDAAYQLHMEDEIGSLEVGKKADLVVLDRNLFETDPYEIHITEVVVTLMDGNIVYQQYQE
jgi:predicted amidohydrolase YtcJ